MDILGHPAERYMLGHCVQPSTGPGHGTQCGPKPCSRRLRRRRMQAHRRGRRVVAPCRMRRRPPPGRWTLCRSRRPSAACSSAPSSISTRRTRARPPPSGSVAPAEARPGFMRATFARLIASGLLPEPFSGHPQVPREPLPCREVFPTDQLPAYEKATAPGVVTALAGDAAAVAWTRPGRGRSPCRSAFPETTRDPRLPPLGCPPALSAGPALASPAAPPEGPPRVTGARTWWGAAPRAWTTCW